MTVGWLALVLCGLALVVVGALVGVAEARASARRRRRGGQLPDETFRRVGRP